MKSDNYRCGVGLRHSASSASLNGGLLGESDSWRASSDGDCETAGSSSGSSSDAAQVCDDARQESEAGGTNVRRDLRRLLVHPRTASVAGGVTVVGLGVASAVSEKALVDALGFDFPCVVQILVQALTAALLELGTGRHGFFHRRGRKADAVRTARLVPLAALYAASLVLAHCARQLQSAHGSYLVAQAALPVVVMLMLSPSAKDVKYARAPFASGGGGAAHVPSLLARCLRGMRITPAALRGARWVALPVAAGAAAAAWTPAYAVALSCTRAHCGESMGGHRHLVALLAWARSALGAAVALAGVVVHAQLLVSTARLMRDPPGRMSAARLLRHLAPLCMLAALALWPVVGAPVDAVEALLATPRVAAAALGVALVGALANAARVAMLQASVSDGPVGVAVLAQARALACLGVGWWAYGFLHWPLQIAGFAVAAASIALWAALRLARPLRPCDEARPRRLSPHQ
ncbi:hypothetical protein GGF44_000414 [Coemansia sp. RSA 1694]|nr:hypothetical protein GGF44_000414 [Coemansia sp. RSA 1694]